MEVGPRPLTGMMWYFLGDNCMGEVQKVAPESVNIDQATDLERKPVEEASIGWVLGDRKSSTFLRQMTGSCLG